MFAESEFRYARWKKAVQKSMNWETTEPVCNGNGEASEVPTILCSSGRRPGVTDKTHPWCVQGLPVRASIKQVDPAVI